MAAHTCSLQTYTSARASHRLKQAKLPSDCCIMAGTTQAGDWFLRTERIIVPQKSAIDRSTIPPLRVVSRRPKDFSTQVTKKKKRSTKPRSGRGLTDGGGRAVKIHLGGLTSLQACLHTLNYLRVWTFLCASTFSLYFHIA